MCDRNITDIIMRKELLLFMLTMLVWGSAAGQETPRTDTLGVEVYFRQGLLYAGGCAAETTERVWSRSPTACVHCSKIPRAVFGRCGSFRARRPKARRKPTSAWRQTALRASANTSTATSRRGMHRSTSCRRAKTGRGLLRWSQLPICLRATRVLGILYDTPVWVIENGKVVDSQQAAVRHVAGRSSVALYGGALLPRTAPLDGSCRLRNRRPCDAGNHSFGAGTGT